MRTLQIANTLFASVLVAGVACAGQQRPGNSKHIGEESKFIRVSVLESATSTPITPIQPDAITGLQFWFKSDTGVLDAGGASADADEAVATWQDQSGNGRHITQSTADNRPLRKASVINSRDVVRFDGSNDALGSASNFATNQPNTFFAVVKLSVAATNKFFWDSSQAAGNEYCALKTTGTSGDVHISAGTAAGAINYGTTAFHIVMVVFNGAASQHQIDNGTTLTVDANTRAMSGVRLGCRRDELGGFLNGDIAEVFAYDSDLSASNKAGVIKYLQDRYAL